MKNRQEEVLGVNVKMLKRQEGYILKHIDDKTYLLPYGQKIADLRKGIQLNDTGAFIWNVLEQPQDIYAIQDLLIAHYTPDADIEMQLRKDVSQFVEQLLQLGILREELHRLNSPYYQTLQLANCIVRTISLLFPRWHTLTVIHVIASCMAGIFIMCLKATSVCCICRTSKTGKLLFVSSCSSVPS